MPTSPPWDPHIIILFHSSVHRGSSVDRDSIYGFVVSSALRVFRACVHACRLTQIDGKRLKRRLLKRCQSVVSNYPPSGLEQGKRQTPSKMAAEVYKLLLQGWEEPVVEQLALIVYRFILDLR